VLPGDEIHSVSEVTEVRRSRSKPDRGIVTLRVETRNQRDAVVLEGTDVIMVGARSGA
jgi:acyl dehydratase